MEEHKRKTERKEAGERAGLQLDLPEAGCESHNCIREQTRGPWPDAKPAHTLHMYEGSRGQLMGQRGTGTSGLVAGLELTFTTLRCARRFNTLFFCKGAALCVCVRGL